jgi:phage gpG-like protein
MPVGPEVDITVTGAPVVRRRLLRISRKALDGREAFRAIAGILRRAVVLQYKTEGSYGGTHWQELAPSTIAHKQRANLDPAILKASGALYDSLVDPEDEHHIQRITKRQMRWGSNLPYGIYHQSERQRKQSAEGRDKLPRRPLIALRESDKRAAVKEVQRSLFGTR